MRPASRKYAAKRIRVRKEMSASGLHACEAVYPGRHVAIVAGIGLQFKEYGQRPRRFTGIVEQCSKAVEEFTSSLGRG